MSERLRKWSMNVISCLIVAVVAILAYVFHQRDQAHEYVEQYKALGGAEVIAELADTYKGTIELYSNYKLTREAKQKIMDKLNALNRKLQEVDRKLNSQEVGQRIDFSFVYHDIKLVNLSLSDATKDDIVPVIVLHAMEGIGDLKKEITYIQYR
jgi:hypothetical protein